MRLDGELVGFLGGRYGVEEGVEVELLWGGEMEGYGLFCNLMGLSTSRKLGLTFNYWFGDKDVWKGFGY